MKRVVLLLLLVAAGVGWWVMLPRPAIATATVAGLPPAVRGAIHVHSVRSDGTGTPDDIAAAAAQAGLRFVVFTDHGNALREPDPPAYRSGVLCIDAVEISTDNGHLVALGLGKAPYPLGGESRDVVEDVHRLGGMAIAAHPASPKPELQWTDWTPAVDGIEWLNGDSEWRDEDARSLARVLFGYPGRKPESLAALLDRPDALLRTWDRLAARRPLVALAAADAHARIGLRTVGEPFDNGASLWLPSYEQLFRTFSISVTGVTLVQDPLVDARAVLGAISGGRVFSTIDAVASPGALAFSAQSGTHRASMGGSLMLNGPVTLRVQVQAPAGAQVVLLQDGAQIAAAPATGLLTQEGSSDPAAYRVEVRVPNAPGTPPVPWLLSNPIYAGIAAPAEESRTPHPAPAHLSLQYGDGPVADWRVETGAQSRAVLDRLNAVGGSQIGFRFAISGAVADSPYAALVMPAGSAIAQHDRLLFTARASRPMRVSVQLRAEDSAAGERWHRSVYLDETPRTITVFFDEMRPRGSTSQRRPALDRIRSVLFVVDSVNAAPGMNGQLLLDDVKYGR